MTDALTLVKSALAKWRKYHGEETLYYKCQWFDGWYIQWAFEGFTDSAEKSILTYRTALVAAQNTVMDRRITHVNDPDLEPGMRLYFAYGTPGHIVTFIGWDGDRALCTQTANGGDTVIKLSNNLKICHADTIDLTFLGASAYNGKNKKVTGLTAYRMGGAVAGGKVTSVAKTLRVASNRRSVPSTVGSIGATYPAGKRLTVDTFKKGRKVTVGKVTSDIWFGIKGTGQYVAAACFTDQKTTNLKNNGTWTPTVKKVTKRYARIGRAWYFYESLNNALRGLGFSTKRMLPKGDYELVQQGDTASPYLVKSDRGDVYLGTRRTAPSIIRK